MKELLLKSLICVVLAVIVVNFFTAISYADNFDIAGYNATAGSSIKDPFQKGIGAVVDVIRIVGTGVAIIIISYIGMKYMMAAPGERADMKKSSIQFVVGAIIVFGSANILAAIVTFATGLFPE